MANPEHVEIVKRGKDAIAAWRKENPDERLDLNSADFDNADLQSADLGRASLVNARFVAADLRGADLRAADLTWTNFTRANLRLAEFSRSTTLNNTVFTEADIRLVKGPLWFDDTRVLGMKVSRLPQHPWYVLCRSYTGSAFAFVLLFTVIAFLPLLGQAVFWASVGRAEQHVLPMAVSAVDKAVDVLRRVPDPPENVQHWLNRARASTESDSEDTRTVLDLLADVPATLGSVKAEFGSVNQELQEAQDMARQAGYLVRLLRPSTDVCRRRVWQLVLGIHQGLFSVFLASLLVTYNLGRGILTNRVGALRDDQDQANYTPTLGQYQLLWYMHSYLLKPLFYVSIAFGMYQFFVLMSTPVLVPF